MYNDNDNDNKLFLQTKSNEKHHKGNINNTYKYQHYNVRAKEIALEDIMAASIQPPVIFKNLIRRITVLK